jgi:aryl-phospho-beta-D-glucosidase BglC (GH1 family)
MILAMKKYQITSLFLLLVLFIEAQDRTKAFEINQKLGRGINYGNMFEAPSETAWGNPWQPEYPEIIANLGFDHVRMPIRWEPSDRSSSTPPYTIESSFLARIKEVVDLTLSKGLYVIINMHHHEALYDDPDGQKDHFLVNGNKFQNILKTIQIRCYLKY